MLIYDMLAILYICCTCHDFVVTLQVEIKIVELEKIKAYENDW